MKSGYSEIVLIVDRSGSMRAIQSDAEGGLNQLIDDQKKGPGECRLSLVQFDTEYEFIHRAVPIAEVPKYSLVPRGYTALLDAVGRAIVETGERLSKMDESDRPESVLVAIVTDGRENASREYNRDQVRKMITEQTNTYNWKFTYLGANQDAFAEAWSIGISANAAMQFAANAKGARGSYVALSHNILRCRTAPSEAMNYTSAERKAAAGEAV